MGAFRGVFLFLTITSSACGLKTIVEIDVNSTDFTRFKHFWKSTGFCPPDPKEDINKYLLSDEQKINIALISSLPQNGIEQVRIHWLMNLLKIWKNKDEELSYDFTDLDAFLNVLYKNKLTPGFELMIYPTSDAVISRDREFWKNITYTVTKRYISKYGLKSLQKWRFETWNEPDLKMFNVLNFNLDEYLNYVNGCSRGLSTAFKGEHFKFLGPAGLFKEKNHPLCWGLLKTCKNSVNCSISYLSFHKKGSGTASGVVNETLSLLTALGDHFLSYLPIVNDEADIEKNWAQPLQWRADARYAVEVIKVIIGFQKLIVEQRNVTLELLSNDNGFLNYHPYYFEQRTLFARFQMNFSHPRHSQFIKKPVYVALALLSLLGNEKIPENIAGNDENLRILATRSAKKPPSFSVVVSYEGGVGRKKSVNLLIKNLWKCTGRYTIYTLDNQRTNPYNVWLGLGKPYFPDKRQRKLMRDAEGPIRLMEPSKRPPTNIVLNLTNPSIFLVHFCCKPKSIPGKIRRVHIIKITTHEILLSWKYSYTNNKCIKTFEIEFKSACGNNNLNFTRINAEDTIFQSYHYAPQKEGSKHCETTNGTYRVRAIDYWGRPGPYSCTSNQFF